MKKNELLAFLNTGASRGPRLLMCFVGGLVVFLVLWETGASLLSAFGLDLSSTIQANTPIGSWSRPGDTPTAPGCIQLVSGVEICDDDTTPASGG